MRKEVIMMKLKKIFAGMAASAIAATMISAVSASADSAGIFFQTDKYTYRDTYGTDHSAEAANASFPNAAVGVSGGGYGFDDAFVCTDVTIDGDNTYTVSCAGSGTITVGAEDLGDGVTREGSKWSMQGVTEPNDAGEFVFGDAISKFNMLGVTTDIPCEFDDDGNALVNGNIVKAENATITIGSKEYTMDLLPANTESDYLTLLIVNTYAKDADNLLAVDDVTTPGEGEDITVTFTLTGLSGDASTDSSTDSTASSTDSTTDSKDSGSSSTTSSSSSSAASTTSSKAGSTGGSTTSKTTSSTATSSAASDATESPEAGAAAGIALALAAVAGAAVVVTRKRG